MKMSKILTYKKRGLNLQEDVDQRQLRRHRKSIHQKDARGNLVNERRGLVDKATPAITSSSNVNLTKRQQQLQKYKEEKLLKKKLEAERKKPAFKFCKIKYETPAFLNVNEPPKVEKPGVITRGMAKASTIVQKQQSSVKGDRRLHKENVDESSSKTLVQRFKVPKPVAKTVSKATINVSENDEPLNDPPIQSRKSFAPDNFKFVTPANLPTYPFTAVINSSTVNETASRETPQIEPTDIFATTDDEATTNVKTTSYFKNLLSSTTTQLTEIREKWSEISKANQELISENVFGKIDSVVGQTNLLITKKFKQFAGLIDDCDDNTSGRMTLIDDLQGFWDMMYFQVEDLLEKYKKLDQIMANDWVEFISPVKRFKKQGSKPLPITKVRANKTQDARLRLAKTKVLKDTNVFSPFVDNDNTTQAQCLLSPSTKDNLLAQTSTDIKSDIYRLAEIQPSENSRTETLVRLSERQSFLRQMTTRENLTVDKSTLSNLFSPLKSETDKYSATAPDQDLIRFSNVHCLTNKENIAN